MFFYNFVAEHQLLSFVLLNFFFIDIGQLISVMRKGYGQIVSLAGYYGDRCLIFLIMLISVILSKHGVKFHSSLVDLSQAVAVFYAVSAVVAYKFLPMPAIEDVYHHFVSLPLFVIILGVGGVAALYFGSLMEQLEIIALWAIWFVLLLLDIKLGRLDQVAFMRKCGLKI